MFLQEHSYVQYGTYFGLHFHKCNGGIGYGEPKSKPVRSDGGHAIGRRRKRAVQPGALSLSAPMQHGTMKIGDLYRPLKSRHGAH